ncbi:bone marrow stromal antigen 2 isoform X1 [Bos taurus]|nr:bone marrow stromal antigen 2 isoform X1 [Bos taurus]
MDTEEDMSEFVMPIDKEKDSSESALCGRKLPLWLGLLLLLVAVGLLVPMIYFAVIANSKACVDGLQAQKECQEVNQHVQRQLTQAQELLNEKKAEAATCKQAVVTLRDSLKKEQARVEELQGELATLNQQLHDLSEKLRCETTPRLRPFYSTPRLPSPFGSEKPPMLRGTKFKSQLVPAVTHPWGGHCSLSSPATWGRSGDS